jgi:hypothetical protein
VPVVDPMFGENAYVVFEKPGGSCWIIDPSFEPQPRQIAEIVGECRSSGSCTRMLW